METTHLLDALVTAGLSLFGIGNRTVAAPAAQAGGIPLPNFTAADYRSAAG